MPLLTLDLQPLEGDSAAPDGLNLELIDQSHDRIRRSPGRNKGGKKPKPPKGSDYPKPPKGTNGGRGTIFGGPFVLNMPSNSPPSYPSYPYPPHQPSYPYPPQFQPPQPESNPQPNPWQYYG